MTAPLIAQDAAIRALDKWLTYHNYNWSPTMRDSLVDAILKALPLAAPATEGMEVIGTITYRKGERTVEMLPAAPVAPPAYAGEGLMSDKEWKQGRKQAQELKDLIVVAPPAPRWTAAQVRQFKELISTTISDGQGGRISSDDLFDEFAARLDAERGKR
jgi:hypothetical protein